MSDNPEPTIIDKILDIRRIQKYLKGNTQFRKYISERMDQAEIAQERILIPTQEMVQSHLAFLDFLSSQSFGGEPPSPSNPGRDYRMEFVTFYLQHRPEKKKLNRGVKEK